MRTIVHTETGVEVHEENSFPVISLVKGEKKILRTPDSENKWYRAEVVYDGEKLQCKTIDKLSVDFEKEWTCNVDTLLENFRPFHSHF